MPKTSWMIVHTLPFDMCNSMAISDTLIHRLFMKRLSSLAEWSKSVHTATAIKLVELMSYSMWRDSQCYVHSTLLGISLMELPSLHKNIIALWYTSLILWEDIMFKRLMWSSSWSERISTVTTFGWIDELTKRYRQTLCLSDCCWYPSFSTSWFMFHIKCNTCS